MRTKVTLETKVGVLPEPIRKRGYHRALKRGALWALSKQPFIYWHEIHDHLRVAYTDLLFKDTVFKQILDD